jgi:DNA-binding MarR family transcriptional regulator
MSYANYEALKQILELDEKLSTSEFAFLIAIAKFANKNNECWALSKTIQDIARISESTYKRCLKKLQQKQLIKIKIDEYHKRRIIVTIPGKQEN